MFFIPFSVLVSVISALAQDFSHALRLVSFFTGGLGGEFVVKAVLKRGVKRGVLHAVSLILLVVFMGGVLAESADAVNSVASGKPVIGGVVAVGESLFADVSGVRDIDGVPSSFVYQWVRVDGGVEEDISGATLAIYNVVSADESKLLKVKVSFIDGVGYAEGPLVSDSTGAVLDAAPIVSHGTKLSGTISLSGFNSQSIWSDGITLYALHSNLVDSRIYAYRMSDKSRDSGKDLDVASDIGTFLTGIGFDGQAMLIGSRNEVRFYAVDSVYKLPRWSEDSGKDCEGVVSTGCSVDVNGYGVGIVDPADDYDWWSLELEGGKTYAIDVKGAGDQSGNDNAGTLLDPFVILYSRFGENPVLVDFSDNVDDGQNNNSRVVYLVGLDEGGTYYVSVAKAQNSSEGGTYTMLVKDSNSVPVFTTINFSVGENTVNIGAVVASDSDALDDVTGYSVSGGVDSALFSITAAGVLSFVSAPDFERPADDGGNNVYNVVVTASGGSGGRVRTATQTITITVTDVDEVPSRPSAPVLSSPSSTSLLVTWSEPDNAGPAINDYDVQYKEDSNSSFLNWTHDGTATNTTITGLNENTAYDVQVRATSDEGTSGWSPVASGTTGVTPNNLPEFSSGTTFSVQENVAEVSTVVADDGDTQDSVTGYSVSGGADRLLFSITNTGILTFVSAPDFERFLLSVGVKHVPSRVGNPQTNGKLERHWREYDRHRWRFNSLKEYVEW